MQQATPAQAYQLDGNADNMNQIDTTSITADDAHEHLSDPQLAERMRNLGVSLVQRFVEFGGAKDLIAAISFQRQAVQHTSEGDPDMLLYLSGLGYSLQSLFSVKGEIRDLSEAISCQRRVIQLAPDDHPDLHIYLSELGFSLHSQFSRTADLSDISEAISCLRKAAELALPEGHESLPLYLSALAQALRTRFSTTQQLEDISEAILRQELAAELTSEQHPARVHVLYELGISFQSRFSITEDISDISAAISYRHQVVQLTSELDAAMPSRFYALGYSFQSRFASTKDLQDISEAIKHQRKAVDHTSDEDPELTIRLTSLALSLRYRFLRTGELKDISEAITIHQKAIQHTPEGHPDMSARLAALGQLLQLRYCHTAEPTDISEAIEFQRKSIKLITETDELMPQCLSLLGSSLQTRFMETGELVDISEAISLQQKAVQLIPEGHPDMAPCLSGLGISFQYRSGHTNELTDISDAILFSKKAVELTPKEHPDMVVRLAALGTSLQSRFTYTGDLNDISEAISCQQRAAQLIAEGHPDFSGCLSIVGSSFCSRFSKSEDLADISEALSYHQRAVRLTPKEHPWLPFHLSELAKSYNARFSHTRALEDISQAISHQLKATELTPKKHPDLPHRLVSLSFSLAERFDLNGDIGDIQAAISNLVVAAKSNLGPPSTRLDAAKDWIQLSEKHEHDSSQLLDAYGVAIGLISHLAGLEQTIDKRHDNLLDISALTASAASVAFSFGKFGLALEWLEQGRCLVWNQLNNLRSPLDKLRDHDRDLADEIKIISQKLDKAGSRVHPPIRFEGTDVMPTRISLQDEEVAHIKLANQWERLLAKVRSIPDFEDFLQPPKSSTLLRGLPRSGVVILINAHKDRCDALALRSGCEPLHIPLSRMSYIKADDLRNALKMHLRAAGLRLRGADIQELRGMRYESTFKGKSLKNVLSILWKAVVKPLLEGLGYLEPPGELQRIWWCATGPFSFLPIHAAGDYDGSTSSKSLALSDFAISSYIPTVRTLVDLTKSSRRADTAKQGLFMVSQPDTPGLRPIPSTTKEIRQVERVLKDRKVRVMCLDSAAATVARVIQHMNAYTSIHLACHAQQDTEKPLNSAFALYDGELKLSAIIQQRLVDVDLAFLSACQTSAGDEKLSEEAVHLAGGMLAAAYRGVVATMWSIQDRHGPGIATDFYSSLVKEHSSGLRSENAAVALHHAAQNLRKAVGDSEAGLLSWVPYVYFGL